MQAEHLRLNDVENMRESSAVRRNKEHKHNLDEDFDSKTEKVLDLKDFTTDSTTNHK